MIKGLPRWIIDQARSHAASVDAGKPVDQKTIYRTRSDPIQTDNFLHDFISQPTYLQDVAFGTKKLRLESGEEIVTSGSCTYCYSITDYSSVPDRGGSSLQI